MNEFLLMHKDREVAIVSIANSGGSCLLHVNELLNPFYLPFGVKNSTTDDIDDLLTLWLDSRCSICGRYNGAAIFEMIGVSSNSQMIQHSHLCSITDCYWFKRVDEAITWNDVSFHKNKFSSNLNEPLFYHNPDMVENFESPDITTDGALPKTWIINDDGEFVLLKGNRKSTIEACYEVIADMVFTDLGIDHIPYHLDIRRGIVSSACKSIITSDKEEMVPIENLMRDYNCVGQYNFLPTLYEWGFERGLNMMFLGDAIIGNIDRHARNYCVIVDSDTQQIKRLSPMFDQGGCYLTGNHGFLEYPPSGVNFNKTIPMIPKELLILAKNINIDRIQEKMNELPMSDIEKQNVIAQLKARVENIVDFAER